MGMTCGLSAISAGRMDEFREDPDAAYDLLFGEEDEPGGLVR